jgi:hypothetical protein
MRPRLTVQTLGEQPKEQPVGPWEVTARRGNPARRWSARYAVAASLM